MNPPDRIVMLSPMLPAPTGNGLAMRLWAWLCGAAVGHGVDLFVVPVAGSSGVEATLPPNVICHVVSPPYIDDSRDLVAWLTDPVWRERLARLAPIHAPVRLAPPALATRMVGSVSGPPSLVLACRLVLGPLGLAVSEQLGIPLVIDVDDDEHQFQLATGDAESAAAMDRLAALCLPAADLVTTAAAEDAAGISARLGLAGRVAHVPNCVEFGEDAATPRTGNGRLLMVANLTYEPNIRGARWFVDEVLPLLPDRWSLDLVGEPAPEVVGLAGPRVRVHGWLPELDECYAPADVVIVPVHHGSGTRIKLLEACAHRRPVVSTSLGASGLGLRAGTEVLIADTPAGFAAAVERAGLRAFGDSLALAAHAAASVRHNAVTVRSSIDGLLRRVATGGVPARP